MVALFDTSLSMQWEKLERSFQALETLLKQLRPQDRFSVLLFNSEVSSFRPAPVPASIPNVEAALAFTRGSSIRAGTDIQRALTDGLAQIAHGEGERYLVLIGDGGATEGVIQNGKLSSWYATAAVRSSLRQTARTPSSSRSVTMRICLWRDCSPPITASGNRFGPPSRSTSN